jgi:hypothetical protein
MWVKAFKDDALGSPLDEACPIADLAITIKMISLMPGQSLQGEIDLRRRFPDLEEALMRRNVVVFWSHVPELDNGKTDLRMSGSLIIPKKQ